MKRYDPKIKLCISQGTDTNLDILEVMRNFKKVQFYPYSIRNIMKANYKR